MLSYGFDERLADEAAAYQGLYVGRIISQSKSLYQVICEEQELTAEVSGRFRHEAGEAGDYPAVGDFVMLDRENSQNGNAIIHHILPRKSAFIRRAAGTSGQTQIVAANIDTAFVCMSLNDDFSLRRLERYLSIAWDSGATPVVVLTKLDLCTNAQERVDDVFTVALGVDVLETSSMTEDGYAQILSYMHPGKTIAFIGSSGVGKSTLINRLIGKDKLSTQQTRDDGKGRHTTTRRELILLQNGAMVIDTPGMREIGVSSADFSKSFTDIETLSSKCRFHDCTHTSEPDCAVQRALLDGILGSDRFFSYQRLKKEAKYDGLNAKQIETVKINEMFHGMGGMKNARNYIKEKNTRRYLD